MAKLVKTDLEFVVRRIPKDVRDLMTTNNMFLGGGFIRETVSGGEVQDVDLFGESKDQLNSMAKLLQTKRDGSRIHQTTNAITLISTPRLPVQFITRWVFESPELAVESFDFTVCQAVIYYDQRCLRWESVISETFYSDLAAKRLVYTDPVREEESGGSLMRVLKFIKRGYNIQPASLGRVVARLVAKIEVAKLGNNDMGAVIGGLLREVDPRLVVDGLDWVDEHGKI